MFWKYAANLQNTFSWEHLWTAASVIHHSKAEQASKGMELQGTDEDKNNSMKLIERNQRYKVPINSRPKTI